LEHGGNPLGLKEKKKDLSPPPFFPHKKKKKNLSPFTPSKRKKKTIHECMLSLPINFMKFLFSKLFIIIYDLG